MPNRILPQKMFIDALLLRFNLNPSDLPLKCPAMKCQEDFTLNHADICPYGGVVIRRHDYVKMVLAQHAEKAYGACSVVVEPLLGKIEEGARDTLIGNLNDQARGDIIIRNFNGMQTTTYFDVGVLSPTCDSNKRSSVSENIAKMEKQKNKDYADRIKHNLGGFFIPCIFSSGGGIGPAANKVIKNIANKASSNSLEKYEDIKNEIRLDIVFSLLKSRIEGIRSCRNNIASQLQILKMCHDD